MPKLLAELKSAGKLLGVTSGNVERIGWAKLKAAGIGEYFSFGSFSDRNETRTEIFRWGADEARRRLGGEAQGVLCGRYSGGRGGGQGLRISGDCGGDWDIFAGGAGKGRAGDVHPRLRNPVELRTMSGIR